MLLAGSPLYETIGPDTLAKYKGDQYLKGWAELWDNDTLPWDKGSPNPALEDTLIQQRSTIGGPLVHAQDKTYRKKALVPGCGRGFDVLLLASFGYDAYGLEYSAAGVEACKSEQAINGHRYPVRDPEVGQGEIIFVQGDFFQNDWLEKLNLSFNQFDLIYDYSFLCALSPSMRPMWALRHTQLLTSSPVGNLICLEFPRHKDPLKPGPPYGLSSEAYMEHLSHPGEDIPYDSQGFAKNNPLRESSERGLERVAHFQPARTHANGKDEQGVIQDRVSVWRRRN